MKLRVGIPANFPLLNVRRGDWVFGGVATAPPQTGPSLHLTISSEEIAAIAASTKRLRRWIPSATPGLLQLSMGLISPPSKAGPSWQRSSAPVMLEKSYVRCSAASNGRKGTTPP